MTIYFEEPVLKYDVLGRFGRSHFLYEGEGLVDGPSYTDLAPNHEEVDAPEDLVDDEGRKLDKVIVFVEPKKNSKVEDWEEYAVTQGYDPSEGLTRKQLIERYGSPE